MKGENHETEVNALVDLIKKLNSSGHNPATSGNYSLMTDNNKDYAWISESGIDKANFKNTNFIPVHLHTKEILAEAPYIGRKSSDETAIHLMLYRQEMAKCVLHSHLLESLLFVDLFENQSIITISGLEMIKAFKGIKSHVEKIHLLAVDNTQDIETLADHLSHKMKTTPHIFGIILRGHGLYTWGDSVKDAKRHLEALEYLFKYHVARKNIKISE